MRLAGFLNSPQGGQMLTCVVFRRRHCKRYDEATTAPQQNLMRYCTVHYDGSKVIKTLRSLISFVNGFIVCITILLFVGLTIWQGISFGASPAWTHGLLYSNSSRRRLFCQLISLVGKYFSPSQLKVVLQRSHNLSFYRFSFTQDSVNNRHQWFLASASWKQVSVIKVRQGF